MLQHSLRLSLSGHTVQIRETVTFTEIVSVDITYNLLDNSIIFLSKMHIHII